MLGRVGFFIAPSFFRFQNAPVEPESFLFLLRKNASRETRG